jgi:hypothetical protein
MPDFARIAAKAASIARMVPARAFEGRPFNGSPAIRAFDETRRRQTDCDN